MLEFYRKAQNKKTVIIRMAAILLPIALVAVLLIQTVFARNTYLIKDGSHVTLHTTYATDPEEVLDEAGLQLGRDDTYTTHPGFALSEITIQRMQEVTVIFEGKAQTVSTYGETVQELLERLELKLSDEDVVSESRNAMTYDGMVVTISRNIAVEETYIGTVAYKTQYCYDASLPEGQERVLTQGVDGQALYTASVHYVDGREVGRTVLSTTVLREPVDALVAVGTAVEMPDYAPESPSLKWPTKPGVLTIGDGIIVTPEGEILTYSHSDQFVATAYNNTDPGCTIYTYIGTLCRVGAIAVDPRVIPLGTKMYIVTNDGQYIYGYSVAEDTGGAIKGHRVDLYFDTVDECFEFGIRDCTVYFLN